MLLTVATGFWASCFVSSSSSSLLCVLLSSLFRDSTSTQWLSAFAAFTSACKQTQVLCLKERDSSLTQLLINEKTKHLGHHTCRVSLLHPAGVEGLAASGSASTASSLRGSSLTDAPLPMPTDRHTEMSRERREERERWRWRQKDRWEDVIWHKEA